jgi:hypothetical protein
VTYLTQKQKGFRNRSTWLLNLIVPVITIAVQPPGSPLCCTEEYQHHQLLCYVWRSHAPWSYMQGLLLWSYRCRWWLNFLQGLPVGCRCLPWDVCHTVKGKWLYLQRENGQTVFLRNNNYLKTYNAEQEQVSNAYKLLIRPLGTLKCRWEDKIMRLTTDKVECTVPGG